MGVTLSKDFMDFMHEKPIPKEYNTLPERIKKTDMVPEGAIRLSKHEAIMANWNRMTKTLSLYDSWAFTCSRGIVSGVNTFSCFYIHDMWCKILGIPVLTYKRALIPVLFFPSVCSALLHRDLVTEKILYGANCQICVEIRSSVALTFFGFVFPAITSPCMLSLHPDFKSTDFVQYFKKQIQTNATVKKTYVGAMLALWAIGGLLAERQVHQFNKAIYQPREYIQ